MFKKILVFIFLFFSFFQVNAYDINWEKIWQWVTPTTTSLAQDYLNWWWSGVKPTISESHISKEKLNSLQNSIKERKAEIDWLTDPSSLTSSNFSINTNTFSPVAHHSGDTKQVVNFVLWTIIQKLMIAIWVISLLVMTIWAWYMIFYHWQDELLSKGKSIFNSWIIALIVALSSYYIVSLVRLILYSNS